MILNLAGMEKEFSCAPTTDDPIESRPFARDVKLLGTCCHKCNLPILDRFFMSIGSQVWHQECLRCNSCEAPLNQKCYTKGGNFYCPEDFNKFFGPKCSACLGQLKPTDLVRLAKGIPFHLHCFCCHVCQRQLVTGDECYMDHGTRRVLCKEHYLSTGPVFTNLSSNKTPSDQLISSSSSHEINRGSESTNSPPQMEDLSSEQRKQHNCKYPLILFAHSIDANWVIANFRNYNFLATTHSACVVCMWGTVAEVICLSFACRWPLLPPQVLLLSYKLNSNLVINLHHWPETVLPWAARFLLHCPRLTRQAIKS
ncbi:LIM/homeobox protein Lhx5 [Cichlidogyrus casuarinus]|uniref:LIM/homeobox protein Lhx5 n=1 Tax=Cichlidogyrus casuarinus TaxID=1844966 RepID=A0ABD2QFP2_9PLAT